MVGECKQAPSACYVSEAVGQAEASTPTLGGWDVDEQAHPLSPATSQ